MKIDEVSNASGSVSVDTIISSLKKTTFKCCNQQCLKTLLEEKEASLRVFLEEWLQLEKKQKEAVLRFSIRLGCRNKALYPCYVFPGFWL